MEEWKEELGRKDQDVRVSLYDITHSFLTSLQWQILPQPLLHFVSFENMQKFKTHCGSCGTVRPLKEN